MDLTFQQMQKYEYGTNRISASRLFQLATILHVPVSDFFKTVEPEIAETTAADSSNIADDLTHDLMNKRKTVELVEAFYAIEDARQRNAALNLLKSLGNI